MHIALQRAIILISIAAERLTRARPPLDLSIPLDDGSAIVLRALARPGGDVAAAGRLEHSVDLGLRQAALVRLAVPEDSDALADDARAADLSDSRVDAG